MQFSFKVHFNKKQIPLWVSINETQILYSLMKSSMIWSVIAGKAGWLQKYDQTLSCVWKALAIKLLQVIKRVKNVCRNYYF